jgi:hypothetical protein
MDSVLLGLRNAGRRHAQAEIERLGIVPRTSYADELPGSIRQLRQLLQQLLGQIRTRVILRTPETVGLFVKAQISKKLIDEVEKKIPGVRDAASRLVPGGFTAGLADVYEQHADLFPCWQYSAVMDNATCSPCRDQDGRRFNSLAALYTVLPNFGPNPRCRGDGRCRCRGVPCAPDGVEPVAGEHPFEDLVYPDTLNALLDRDARQAIADLGRVITIRDPREPDRIPIGRGGTLDDHRIGVYHRNNFGGTPVGIDINPRSPARKRRFYLWHELGHYIDDQWLGPRQRQVRGPRVPPWASERVKEGMSIPAAGGELAELMQTIDDSKVVTELRSLRDDPRTNPATVDYLLAPTEMFARAFSQYVATKLDDREVLLREVATHAGHKETNGTTYMHWTTREFRPIEAAFDKLFAELGWLPSPR